MTIYHPTRIPTSLIFTDCTFAYSYRPSLEGPLAIAKLDWETYCHKVADMIIAEQSPQRVMDVRAKLYELLSHCIPPTVIIKVCCLRLVRCYFFRLIVLP